MERLGHVLILGLGKSGVAAARYCASLPAGEVDSLTVADSSDAEKTRQAAAALEGTGANLLLGVDHLDGEWDVCISSPGIPPHSPLIVSARAASARTVSEIEFAYERSRSPWVAVTGTNGKTTTTALIAHLLDGAGMSTRLVGNIGTPAIEVVAEAGEHEVLVAEVSSFQLSLTQRFHPRVAVLLNVTPDHIDWHGSVDAYAADKARIFANLTADDTAVIDVDDPGSRPYADSVADKGCAVVRVSLVQGHAGGATLVDGDLVLETRGGPVRLVPADDLLIKGSHNISNALAAASAAHALGAAAADIKVGLRSFMPIEHRLEPVGCVAGAEWFNDSKATNPDAVFKAIGAFGQRPIVLLLGGRNKGNRFEPLAREAAGRVRVAVTFGEAGEEIAAAFGPEPSVEVVRAETLVDAVQAARMSAHEGDAVVLSPACASFDEFDGYEHRGDVFKQLVRGMEAGS